MQRTNSDPVGRQTTARRDDSAGRQIDFANSDPIGRQTTARAKDLFREHQESIFTHTDRMFAVLMAIQWIGGIAIAYWISPRTWLGSSSQTHMHVWAAIFLGGAINLFPIALALARPGAAATRHVIATAQMLMSALLIHLTGGRIETHFHVFGSLAFLSFYRDWRVLIPATVVVAADHFLRGVFWPQSVYGVLAASQWRWLEHAGWVLFEDSFLLVAIKRSVSEMWGIAERTAQINYLNRGLEHSVAERTAQLAAANQELKREVTERKQVADQILLQKTRFEKLFENAPVGIVIHDENERILQANRSFETIFQFPLDEIRGQPINETIVPAELTEEASALSSTAAQGKVVEKETVRRRKDGSHVPVQIYGVPVLLNRKPVGGYGLYVDLTERKHLAEQLLHSQKLEAVGILAGGIAHDFNNMLTVINGYSNLILMTLRKGEPISPDTLARNVEDINQAGERAASLTRQLLAFSRKQVLQPKVLHLNVIVTNTANMLQRLIGENIELVLGLGPALGQVMADPGQIEQALVNLAVNAQDAMPQGGKLIIETANVDLTARHIAQQIGTQPGPYVTLSVTDTGVGMDAKTKAHIFEPFFTTKEVGKGTGLGLSTVYGIVEQSGGHILVYSEPGMGTTFRIYLPRANEEKEQLPQRGADAERLQGTGSVLLVEDDAAVRVVTKKMLEMAGYTVLEAADGREALQLCEQDEQPINLVLTDIVMPQMGGRELTERLSQLRPELKVLYMSGHTDDAIVHHGVLEGTPFIEKPFTPELLARKVREALDSPSPVPVYV